MLAGFLAAASAFSRTRWLAKSLRSRAQLEAYQANRLRALLAHAQRHLPHYREIASSPFHTLPIMDKQKLLANFSACNRAGITLEKVRETLANGSEQLVGHVVGHSTGTSGNRGYYVITEAERYAWLGTLLAKALPDALWRSHRVALALPGLSRLYRSASSGSRVSLAYFDLAQGVDAWLERFRTFDADTIVAPPKILRRLAELGALRAKHIFSGAEVLDPLDREIIEHSAGARVREIYMATEGLFGVSCTHGTLHLAEDVVHFEWNRPIADSSLLSPLVTDFTRRAQAMIRYRMNDLLALQTERCPCGSILQPVARVEGRQDDVFWLQTAVGSWRMVTPDVIRNAIVDASPAIRDFRAVQTAYDRIEVTLPPDLPGAVENRVLQELRARLERLEAGPVQLVIDHNMDLPMDRKLRRVRRSWTPPAAVLQSQN
ncbi:F390 synthetase-related protein [Hydrogenophaga sp.]